MVPVLFMLAITPFSPWLDMALERHFYTQEGASGHFVQSNALDFIYVYALIPGQITVIFAGIALLLSYVHRSCRAWRPHALYMVLTLAVGAGVICHALLKDHWGRPRPRQVVEFNGEQQFRPYFVPNFFHQPEPSKSFPCGHCTLGFYFFAFVVLGLRYKSRRLLYGGLFLSLVLGLSLSYTRMAQGGHFLTDVLASALIMWLTALALEPLIYGEEK